MKLSIRQKSNIRHFIYYLVNGTLDFDLLNVRLQKAYHEVLKSDSDLFYKACCVFINQETKYNSDWPDVKRIAQFIYKELDPNSSDDLVTLEPWETQFEILKISLSDDFKSFTRWFIENSVVDKIGYKDYIEDGASFVEQCFAIWANVIECKDGVPINSNRAKERVEEYIKSYYIPGYKDNLESWECELHME